MNYNTSCQRYLILDRTIEELKKRGYVVRMRRYGRRSDVQSESYRSMGVVIGNGGRGRERLVKEKCDFVAAIPMKGDIDSLNASVAAGSLPMRWFARE